MIKTQTSKVLFQVDDSDDESEVETVTADSGSYRLTKNTDRFDSSYIGKGLLSSQKEEED